MSASSTTHARGTHQEIAPRSLLDHARYFHHELEGEFTRGPGGVSMTAILSGISTMWISIPGRSSVNEGPSTSDCSISKSER